MYKYIWNVILSILRFQKKRPFSKISFIVQKSIWDLKIDKITFQTRVYILYSSEICVATKFVQLWQIFIGSVARYSKLWTSLSTITRLCTTVQSVHVYKVQLQYNLVNSRHGGRCRPNIDSFQWIISVTDCADFPNFLYGTQDCWLAK
jgi:hypothetical protein